VGVQIFPCTKFFGQHLKPTQTPKPLGRLPVFAEKNQRRVAKSHLHPVQEPRM